MQSMTISKWVKFCLFNLSVVALIGFIMRYKILFSLPVLQQKNLQHAHSHFAFSAWASLLLMVLMIKAAERYSPRISQQYNGLFLASAVCSYGMLITFSIQGYAFFSILFAALSLLLSFIFCFRFYRLLRLQEENPARSWFTGALIFNVLSSFGTGYLSYMMASKNIDQHSYLASVYWYLHFQYNGWFLFACLGLFIHFLTGKGISLQHGKTIFFTLFISCLPAYGLSVLWLKLPLWVFIIIVISAIVQLLGWILFAADICKKKLFKSIGASMLIRSFLVCAFLACSLKIAFQAASVFPALSKLAFGFRPVVIAYLHLVLLCVITLFLIGYLLLIKMIPFTKRTKIVAFAFLAAVLLNELLLAMQGISAFAYLSIPYINEMLLGAAVILWAGIISLTFAANAAGKIMDQKTDNSVTFH